MSSPTMPLISLETPPDSPELSFSLPSPGLPYISLKEHDDDTIVSPVKKDRIVTKKVSRTAPGTSVGHARKRVKQMDATFPDSGTQPGFGMFDNDPFVDDQPAEDDFHLDGGGLNASNDRRYIDYIECVLDEGTAFFQIGMDMFVVNGWDAKARRSKVCI